jgi:hypothetical protein
MQNRHQAISRCKLLFLQKTNLSLTRQRRSAGGAKRLATRLALASFARLPSVSTPIDLVELSGIEPLTPCLQAGALPAELQPHQLDRLDCSRFGNLPHQPHSIIPNPHLLVQMVGPGRLELPTPRLSSVCSNQLSYGPIRGTGPA